MSPTSVGLYLEAGAGMLILRVNEHLRYAQSRPRHSVSTSLNPWVLHRNRVHIEYQPDEPTYMGVLPDLAVYLHSESMNDELLLGRDSVQELLDAGAARVEEQRDIDNTVVRSELFVPFELPGTERFAWVTPTFPWAAGTDSDSVSDICDLFMAVHGAMSARDVGAVLKHASYKIAFSARVFQEAEDAFRQSFVRTLELLFEEGDIDPVVAPRAELVFFPIRPDTVYEIQSANGSGALRITDDSGGAQGLRFYVAHVEGIWRWIL